MKTSDDQLYSIDLATGVATAIGPTGFDEITSLTFDPGGTTLYGIDTSSEVFVTCDTGTGACAEVGALGFSPSSTGLAFACDDVLYLGDGSKDLYTVNPATGAATLVGDSGEDLIALGARAGGAGCPSGLYGVSDDSETLVCLDTASGIASVIGPLGFDVLDGGLDIDASGTLWFLHNDGGIYTVNPLGGAATATATTDLGFSSLAIGGLSCAAPSAGTVQFGATAFSGLESSGFANVTLTRTGGTNGVVNACFELTPGTASSGVDYPNTTYLVDFADGQGGPQTVAVTLFDDPEVEGPETFDVAFFSGPADCNATYSQPVSATVTIIDDDELVASAIPTASAWGLLALMALLGAAALAKLRHA